MNRLSKIFLLALVGLYSILSILPIQQCSATKEFFFFDCPKDSSGIIKSQFSESKTCCAKNPCCGSFINDSDYSLDLVSFENQEDYTKNVKLFDYEFFLAGTRGQLKIPSTIPKVIDVGFLTLDRYILFETFLC